MKAVKTTKIGGMRRKKKRINPIKNKDNSKEFKNYEKKILNLNNLIKNIDINEYSKFKIYLDTEMEDMAFSIEKYDILKSSKIKANFKDFKDNRLEYLYSYYCSSLDRPIEFKTNAYTFFKNNFEVEILQIMINFIDEIITGIEKKTYLEDNKNNYTSDDVNFSFDLLKLDKSVIPNKEQITNSYNSLINENNKNQLDKALNLLLKRYNNKNSLCCD
jgi:hypothetical protein